MAEIDKICERCGRTFNGLSYDTTCYSCSKKINLENIQKAIETGDEEVDTWSDDYVICPYCGDATDDFCEFCEAYEDGEHEVRCPACGRKYILETDVSYSWETRKIEDDS